MPKKAKANNINMDGWTGEGLRCLPLVIKDPWHTPDVD